jgi:hypothetical protein
MCDLLMSVDVFSSAVFGMYSSFYCLEPQLALLGMRIRSTPFSRETATFALESL